MRNTIESLLAQVEQITESGCWIFMGHCTERGYARVRFNGKNTRVHRLFYEYFVGRIPTGLMPDHTCRVRCCVNPFHVTPKTSKDNVLCGIGLTAMNARKTHCRKGHPYDEINT